MNVENYIQSLIDKRIIPGISLLAAKGGNILFNKQYGYKAVVPRPEPIQADTLYDLASLTKPLVTALLTLYLVEQEKNITLDTKVGTILRQCPFDITLLQLLTHTSGLPAWYPFYLYNPDYLSQILNLKQESKPGRKVNYSCVGYILLLYIIEKISGAPFHKMAREIIFQPLGLKNT
ncbi:MAG: beta-lactamase family protein, partial [bacterium]|nr:beta-lactamase family protein [bacterium]